MKRLPPQSHRLSYSQEPSRHFFLPKLLPGENKQTPGFTFHRAVIPGLECGSSTSSPIWFAFPVSILLLPSTFTLTGLTGLFIASKVFMKQISKATTGLDCASHIYLEELCPGINLHA